MKTTVFTALAVVVVSGSLQARQTDDDRRLTRR